MPHIYPVSDLKNNLNHLTEVCCHKHEPVFLTRKGHRELVLLGLDEYENMLSKLKTTEDEDTEIEAMWFAEIEERYRSIKDGKVT